MPEESDLYYKLYITKDDGLHVVPVQWFDESDYDQNWLFPHEFDTRDEAELWAMQIELSYFKQLMKVLGE